MIIIDSSRWRRRMRKLTATPITTFRGNGQILADLAEIAALEKDVARLPAERAYLEESGSFFARETT